MFRKAILIVFAILLLVLPANASAKSPHDLTFEEQTVDIPRPERIETDNGIVLFLMENHELPIIDLRLITEVGDVHDPDNKAGLTDMVFSLMKSGGTENKPSEAIDEELDFLAVDIGSFSSDVRSGMTLNTLTSNFDRGLEIFLDMLKHPAFEEDRLELLRRQKLESIRRKWDYPRSIIMRYFRDKVYGEDSPWAREPSVETVNEITRDDLIEYHRKYVLGSKLYIGISGDFDREKMPADIKKAFKDWIVDDKNLPETPPLEKTASPGVYYIEKELDQSYIVMGHLGINENNPDRFKTRIFNSIFGAGFSSRLFKEVREKRGLTYSVYGYIGTGPDRGLFTVSCSTKPGTTVEAARVIINEIDRMRNEKVKPEELELAVDYEVNSFAFFFKNPYQILRLYMRNYMRGRPDDYFSKYLDRIRDVNARDVKKAAIEYVHPENMVILILGDKSGFDKPLTELGEVTEITLDKE